MKRIITLFCASAFSVAAFAQANIAVSLTSPTANSTITASQQFTFTVGINNTGTLAISTNDTILFAPTFNGSLLQTQNGPLVYFSAAGLAAGSNTTLTRNLSVSGGQSGTINLCGIAAVIGPNWNNVTESDTTDNESCVNVTYNAGSVSLDEMVLVDIDNITDKSFYANGIFHVDVRSAVSLKKPTLKVYNLAGQEVAEVALNQSNSGIMQEVDFNALGLIPGIYITEISTADGAFRNAHKVVVN